MGKKINSSEKPRKKLILSSTLDSDQIEDFIKACADYLFDQEATLLGVQEGRKAPLTVDQEVKRIQTCQTMIEKLMALKVAQASGEQGIKSKKAAEEYKNRQRIILNLQHTFMIEVLPRLYALQIKTKSSEKDIHALIKLILETLEEAQKLTNLMVEQYGFNKEELAQSWIKGLDRLVDKNLCRRDFKVHLLGEFHRKVKGLFTQYLSWSATDKRAENFQDYTAFLLKTEQYDEAIQAFILGCNLCQKWKRIDYEILDARFCETLDLFWKKSSSISNIDFMPPNEYYTKIHFLNRYLKLLAWFAQYDREQVLTSKVVDQEKATNCAVGITEELRLANERYLELVEMHAKEEREVEKLQQVFIGKLRQPRKIRSYSPLPQSPATEDEIVVLTPANPLQVREDKARHVLRKEKDPEGALILFKQLNNEGKNTIWGAKAISYQGDCEIAFVEQELPWVRRTANLIRKQSAAYEAKGDGSAKRNYFINYYFKPSEQQKSDGTPKRLGYIKTIDNMHIRITEALRLNEEGIEEVNKLWQQKIIDIKTLALAIDVINMCLSNAKEYQKELETYKLGFDTYQKLKDGYVRANDKYQTKDPSAGPSPMVAALQEKNGWQKHSDLPEKIDKLKQRCYDVLENAKMTQRVSQISIHENAKPNVEECLISITVSDSDTLAPHDSRPDPTIYTNGVLKCDVVAFEPDCVDFASKSWDELAIAPSTKHFLPQWKLQTSKSIPKDEIALDTSIKVHRRTQSCEW